MPTQSSEEFEAGRFSVKVFCGLEEATPPGRTY